MFAPAGNCLYLKKIKAKNYGSLFDVEIVDGNGNILRKHKLMTTMSIGDFVMGFNLGQPFIPITIVEHEEKLEEIQNEIKEIEKDADDDDVPF